MRLDFGVVWLNPVADPSTGMSFEVAAIEHPTTVATSAALYAGGNWRMIRRPGRQQVAKVTLNNFGDTQKAQLDDWLGELLWYRDPTGKKFAGYYTLDTGFAPLPMGDSWSAAFTVVQITVSEAV